MTYYIGVGMEIDTVLAGYEATKLGMGCFDNKCTIIKLQDWERGSGATRQGVWEWW